MKFLKEEDEENIAWIKEVVKSFLLIFVLTTITLGWLYIAFLFIFNSLGSELTFSLKFLLGISMIFSVIGFLIHFDDEIS